MTTVYGMSPFCLPWPATGTRPPEAPGAHYPRVPTLILDGEFDTHEQRQRQTVARYPHAKLVVFKATGHTPLEWSDCALDIATDFLRTGAAGDASCASESRLRLPRRAATFPRRTAESPAAAPTRGNRAGRRSLRVARIAADAALDVQKRSIMNIFNGGDGSGPGLRGGNFQSTAGEAWTTTLTGVRWTRDVAGQRHPPLDLRRRRSRAPISKSMDRAAATTRCTSTAGWRSPAPPARSRSPAHSAASTSPRPCPQPDALPCAARSSVGPPPGGPTRGSPRAMGPVGSVRGRGDSPGESALPARRRPLRARTRARPRSSTFHTALLPWGQSHPRPQSSSRERPTSTLVTLAWDEQQVSTGSASVLPSLLHRWRRSSATGAAAFHATERCARMRPIDRNAAAFRGSGRLLRAWSDARAGRVAGVRRPRRGSVPFCVPQPPQTAL